MIRLKLVDGNPDKATCGTLVVGLFQGERPPRGEAGWVDWRLGGSISRAILAGRIDGAAGSFVLMPAGRKLPCQRVIVVGLGPQGDFKSKNLATTIDEILAKTEGLQDTDLAVALPGTKPWPAPRNAAETVGERLLGSLAAAGRSAKITVLGPAEFLADLKEWVRTQTGPVASHVALDEDIRDHGEAREGA